MAHAISTVHGLPDVDLRKVIRTKFQLKRDRRMHSMSVGHCKFTSDISSLQYKVAERRTALFTLIACHFRIRDPVIKLCVEIVEAILIVLRARATVNCSF